MDFYLLMTNVPIYAILTRVFTILAVVCIVICINEKKAFVRFLAFIGTFVCVICTILNFKMIGIIQEKQALDFTNVMITRCNKFSLKDGMYYLETTDKDNNLVTTILDKSLNVSVRNDLVNGYIDNRNKIIYLSKEDYVENFDDNITFELSNSFLIIFPPYPITYKSSANL